jgi:copper(I)-binding protein
MRMHTIFGALAALALSAASILAHEYKLGSLELVHPFARATAPGAAVAGGFVTIRNSGSASDRLVRAEAAFAGKTELHEMKMDGGVMKMRMLADGIEIPAGGEVALKPGDLHIMFIDLREQLKSGEKRKGRLVFEKAGEIEVEFEVEEMGGQGHGETKKN